MAGPQRVRAWRNDTGPKAPMEAAMAWTVDEMRLRILETPVNSRGRKRYGAELREEVLRYSTQALLKGRSQGSVARELGMKAWTLNRWHQQQGKKPRQAFVEVTAQSLTSPLLSRPGAAFEVILPGGYEILVPTGFEKESLRALVAVLEGA